MRKLTYLFGLLLFAGLIFTSCNKDDDEPKDVTPSINFKGGTHQASGMDFVSGDKTLNVSDIFVVGITASSNSGKDLTNLNVVRKYENGAPFSFDTLCTGSSISYDLFFQASNEVGNEDWTFTVEDKDGNTNQLFFTLTTEAIPTGIANYTDIELGSWESSTSSSFASITGETFDITAANADESIQEKIDFVYFDGGSYGHTVMAPNEDIVLTVYPSIGGWATRNATLFSRTTLTAGTFDQIVNINSLLAITSQLDFNITFISELLPDGDGFESGDVFAFQTGAGLFGLMKVTEANQGTTNSVSTIKYDVKVQE